MVFRGAAENMALDQAIFEHTQKTGDAFFRSYCWNAPAVTVGYFHRFAPREYLHDPARGPVRRFTGGGKVEHGEDLTFLLTLPAGSELSSLNATDRYQWIHQIVADCLNNFGATVLLEQRSQPLATGPCFENTVGWDLVDPGSGKKVGGGAQRRSAGHVIHQGSIRVPSKLRLPDADWIQEFLQQLSEEVRLTNEITESKLLMDAETTLESRYARKEWNELARGN
ncbi:MAG: hypothetical protein CMO55_17250 [Verrucomicrobiales bacterium]|nr:hypothetical protein [Verrucomicrobiales bacterium]